VTLFRDYHAWCPYCQKVWLWLEEKRVPYKIQKITMFCYGDKEAWYKKKVPSGMLPAIEIDGQIVTDSDQVLFALEDHFGPLHRSMEDPSVMTARKLERDLFRAWCEWLCRPQQPSREERAKQQVLQTVCEVEKALASTPGPFFLDEFSTADVIFTPYIERMGASLFYYKGYTLRDARSNPNIAAWFDALEARETYLGTQSDYHTHCHDLPPQMGGCYENAERQQQQNMRLVDQGPWSEIPDTNVPEPDDSREGALHRCIKHKDNIIRVNPTRDKSAVDEALRCALTHMMTGEQVQPPPGSDTSLRYICDRVSVPRDMPIWSARHLRQALETTAALAGSGRGPAIPIEHRRDQDPAPFVKQSSSTKTLIGRVC